jgi:hypothetical protein
MLVKVALSYFMEGEHSQGASNPRVFGFWGKRCLEATLVRVCGRGVGYFGLLTPCKRETGPTCESRGLSRKTFLNSADTDPLPDGWIRGERCQGVLGPPGDRR